MVMTLQAADNVPWETLKKKLFGAGELDVEWEDLDPVPTMRSDDSGEDAASSAESSASDDSDDLSEDDELVSKIRRQFPSAL